MFIKPKTEVYWHTFRKKDSSIKILGENKTAEVIIIGGGMTGLMCADALLKLGVSVIILEKNFCGGAATGKSSGFITPASEMDLSTLINESGIKEAKRVWGFITGGTDLIKDAIKKYDLKCDYKEEDSLYITDTKNDIEEIKQEYESRKILGYESSLYEDRESITKIIGSSKYFSALRYGGTFSINAYSFCEYMKKSLVERGVEIYENSPVAKINSGSVEVENFRVSGSKIIFCGDRFVPELGGLKDEVYHAQVFTVVSKSLSDADVLKIFPNGHMMVWDTGLVYKYFRITKDNRLLIGGDDIFYIYSKKEKMYPLRFINSVLKYFKLKFPEVNLEIEYVWPGLMGISKDFLPVISEDKKLKNVYYVGGTSGLPWAAALGNYMVDKMIHGRSDFDSYFSSDRKFPVNSVLQKLIGKKLVFALSHAIFHGVFKKFVP